MSVLTGSGYCPYCREEIMVACTPVADLFHLALTLVTGGLWSVVWFYCRFHARTCICCQCGRRLARYRLKLALPSTPGAVWPFTPGDRSRSDFNRFLVSRNLVYYVPTSARYHRP